MKQQTEPVLDSRYWIGIDLGTTHIALSYLPPRDQSGPVRIFPVPQLVAEGQTDHLTCLPAFRFHPAQSQFNRQQTELGLALDPLAEDTSAVIMGEWARALGAKTQGRLVSSAKTWLSQSESVTLPWGSDPSEVHQVSPVLAMASYLNYLKTAWNQAYPDYPMQQQALVITVPASFDERARALTLEAIEMAGLSVVSLLEEPTAAAYHWFHKHQHTQTLSGLVLVCDMGGGTTDFTLLDIRSDDRSNKPPQGFSVERLAVGDHLVLGGDNMDWALAFEVKAELTKTNPKLKLSSSQWSQLVQSCRAAKETLLQAPDVEHTPVTLLGQGRSMIAQQITTQLSRARIDQLLLEGFFPKVDDTAEPKVHDRGLHESGLAFAHDPAVTKHLAQFLRVNRGQRQDRFVKYVLFNGGVFVSDVFRTRVCEQLRAWGHEQVTELAHQDTQFAVAHGAVIYHKARSGDFAKIQSGSARSYLLALEGVDENQIQGVCVLPQGAAEDQSFTTERVFQLKLGQDVRFQLYASNQNFNLKFAELVTIKSHWVKLPPLILNLPMDAQTNQANLPVKLTARLSELGVLELACEQVTDANQAPQVWQLSFSVRKQAQQQSPQGDLNTTNGQVVNEQAIAAIREIFGPGKKKLDAKRVKGLRNRLEQIMGPRHTWSVIALRALADELIALAKHRRRSAQHERVWFNLVGYGLRPGFGDPGDEPRVLQLIELYTAGVSYAKETPNWVEWWTLWRRIAPGLSAAFQQQLWHQLKPQLSAKAMKTARTKGQSVKAWLSGLEPVIRLAGVLERLPAPEKQWLGDQLAQWAPTVRDHHAIFWALGRVGSRVMVSGAGAQVLSLTQVQPWFDMLSRQHWKKSPWIAFAATLIARRSSIEADNFDESTRAALIERLAEIDCPGSWLNILKSVENLSTEQAQQIYGEALPLGLALDEC